ncbi:T9SS type A sorting domain-containing protein [candidate division KSB1 bacterium]|nr:T9SS type A sorting domain-containing protein [candidate division KSB1 bacterium]
MYSDELAASRKVVGGILLSIILLSVLHMIGLTCLRAGEPLPGDLLQVEMLKEIESENTALLSIDKTLLDYGYALTSLTFVITNNGVVALNWHCNEDPDESWISINGSSSGSLEHLESAVVRVDVSRSQLPAGPNYGQIIIGSNGGDAIISIIVEVGPYPTAPILAVDPRVIDFNMSLERRSFVIKNRGAGTLVWTATASGDVDWLSSIEPTNGALTSMKEAVVEVVVDRNMADVGLNTATIDITTNNGMQTVLFELINGDPPLEIRANVGGEAYSAVNGDRFSADRPYVEGAWGHVRGFLFETTQPIRNTDDDALYQKELFWIDGYKFDLPNGIYTVTLHFAELYYFYIGGRIFDVFIENVLMLDKLDIFAEVGLYSALKYNFEHIAVTDGRLDIDFKHWMAHSKLSAIEVITESTTSPLIAISPSQLDFGVDQNSLTFLIQNIGNDVLDWTIDKNLTNSWITSIVPVAGSVSAGGQQSVAVSIDRHGLANGEYFENLAIQSNGGYASIDLKMSVNEPQSSTQRVNCGGVEDYVDRTGHVWYRDKPYSIGGCGYVRGNSYETTDPIHDTEDDKLYQTEHWDMSEYRFDISNGFYEVNLHFAEIYFNSSGMRVFQVDIEGDRRLSTFDIYKEVGHDRALIKTFMVQVNDQQLNIEFIPGIENPKISAIEIKPVNEEPLLSISTSILDFGLYANTMSFTIENLGLGILHWQISDQPDKEWMKSIRPDHGDLGAGASCMVSVDIDRTNIVPGSYEGSLSIESNGGAAVLHLRFQEQEASDYVRRVNCGSNHSYIDRRGDEWSADRSYTYGEWGYDGGFSYLTTDPIADTFDDVLYQSERWGLQGYKFDLENGHYEIQLLFAEIYFKKSGERNFHVMIEGQQVLTNFDIYSLYGHDRAALELFTTDVTDGQLNIEFIQCVEDPKISAILVRSIAEDPVLSVEPSTLDFGTGRVTMSCSIKNNGCGQLDWAMSGVAPQAWIASIMPDHGTLAAGASQPLTVTVNRDGLTSGEYREVLNILSNGGESVVEVLLSVIEPASYVQRVNCGGVTYYATTGEVWSGDQAYRISSWGHVAGHNYITSDPIASTDEDKIYQSERWGLSSYQFDVPNGDYDVTLLFAEIYFYSSGKRVFHVDLEGRRVLTNFDIYKEAGHDHALNKAFRVTVPDGQLNINFVPAIEDPKIAGIEIRKIESRMIAWDGEESSSVNAEISLPTEHVLYQNYPNPFNPSTTISFDLSEETSVKIDIYNSLGQCISTLLNGKMPAGMHSIVWNVDENSAMPLSSGVYFCVLQIKDSQKTMRYVKRMLLSK